MKLVQTQANTGLLQGQELHAKTNQKLRVSIYSNLV